MTQTKTPIDEAIHQIWLELRKTLQEFEELLEQAEGSSDQRT
ncbi:hypothetical protein [Alicyclobacillus shizuokensis]|nr:hypothetical protein [Alicyclobacillus shizuokensis]